MSALNVVTMTSDHSPAQQGPYAVAVDHPVMMLPPSRASLSRSSSQRCPSPVVPGKSVYKPRKSPWPVLEPRVNPPVSSASAPFPTPPPRPNKATGTKPPQSPKTRERQDIIRQHNTDRSILKGAEILKRQLLSNPGGTSLDDSNHELIELNQSFSTQSSCSTGPFPLGGRIKGEGQRQVTEEPATDRHLLLAEDKVKPDKKVQKQRASLFVSNVSGALICSKNKHNNHDHDDNGGDKNRNKTSDGGDTKFVRVQPASFSDTEHDSIENDSSFSDPWQPQRVRESGAIHARNSLQIGNQARNGSGKSWRPDTATQCQVEQYHIHRHGQLLQHVNQLQSQLPPPPPQSQTSPCGSASSSLLSTPPPPPSNDTPVTRMGRGRCLRVKMQAYLVEPVEVFEASEQSSNNSGMSHSISSGSRSSSSSSSADLDEDKYSPKHHAQQPEQRAQLYRNEVKNNALGQQGNVHLEKETYKKILPQDGRSNQRNKKHEDDYGFVEDEYLDEFYDQITSIDTFHGRGNDKHVKKTTESANAIQPSSSATTTLLSNLRRSPLSILNRSRDDESSAISYSFAQAHNVSTSIDITIDEERRQSPSPPATPLQQDDGSLSKRPTEKTSTCSVEKIPSPCNAVEYSMLLQDPAYRHAQKAGMLWQSLVGQHVRFPSRWWNGARTPPMGIVESFVDNRWYYYGRYKVHSNSQLNDVVRNRGSPGRVLLHIVVQDFMTWIPVQDIAIGCFHPNARGVRLLEQADPLEEDKRDLWLAVRKRVDDVSVIDTLLQHGCRSWDSPTHKGPLGPKRKVTNQNIRAIFGENPPLETIFTPESDLYERLSAVMDPHDPDTDATCPPLHLLNQFVFS